MLKHPQAQQFTTNFVGQWLGLRDIDFTEPSSLLHPEFDAMLKESMVKETELFFAEVLKDDLSLANFVASDFTMLNGRMAKHYGIDGWEFRKTRLPRDSHRGGMLTMASVLKVTANGTTTSPVMRGAWVLDRILGTPPRSRPRTSPRWSRTFAARRPSASNWPSTGRSNRARAATCRSTHPVSPSKVSMSSVAGATVIAPQLGRGTWKKSASTVARCRTCTA